MKKLEIKLSCGGLKLGVNNCPFPLDRVNASNHGQREVDIPNFCPTTNSNLKGVSFHTSFGVMAGPWYQVSYISQVTREFRPLVVYKS